jgi:hypothetical protein
VVNGTDLPLRVYAIEDAGRGLVKIGLSKDPENRLAGLCGSAAMLGYECQYVLLGSAPIEFAYFERTIHDALREARHKGEWFARANPEVDDFIRNVIVLNNNGRHLMRPSTWLYRRQLLPEAWKPKDSQSNHEIAWNAKLAARNARIDQEIIDRDRAEELAQSAQRQIDDLDFDRIIKGEIDP